MNYYEKLGIILLFAGLYLRVVDSSVGWNILASLTGAVGAWMFMWSGNNE